MRGPDIQRRLVPWLLVAGWLAVIFGFSSLQGSALPAGTGDVAPLAHFLEYAVLGALVAYAVAPRTLTVRIALVLVLVCSLYAASDEFHQSFVPGRTPDVADWAMDTAGAGIAIGAIAAARRRRV
jgi:VanZ family protein